MAKGHRAFKTVLAAVAATMLVPSPAVAQQSEGYEFLKAVRDKEGDIVTQALSTPGSTVINTRDISKGHTALHIVVERRDLTWIRFLTQKGANPNIADNNGVTPLVLASRLNFVEGVQALVKAGARVDEVNATGETPLIAAVHTGNAELMKVLLDAGANPDRADNSGRTAREYAKLQGERSRAMVEIQRADEKKKDSGVAQQTYGPTL